MMPVVMIIEDDLDIRSDLAGILMDEGYRVATAANGLEALAYLRSTSPPGLILLDLMMPVMDGWQFRFELLKDETLAAVPLVIVSGAGNVPSEAASLGAVGYLNKPFDLESLLALIEKHCHADRRRLLN